MNIWTIIQNDWHKILIVIIALIQGAQYVVSKIKPVQPKQVAIHLPEKGCVITIKPLD